jgi:hypothetical protein
VSWLHPACKLSTTTQRAARVSRRGARGWLRGQVAVPLSERLIGQRRPPGKLWAWRGGHTFTVVVVALSTVGGALGF